MCSCIATDTYKRSAYYGQGSGSIWLDHVQCDGTEVRLLDCTAQPIGEHINCGHGEDVGVLCSGKCLQVSKYNIVNKTAMHTHTCTDDASTAITWAALRYLYYQKQVSIKRFL